MFKKRGQGQSWSLDIILALVVFVLVVGIFYTLVGQNRGSKTTDLTLGSNTIVSSLDSSNGINNNFTVIYNGAIDPTKISSLYGSNYTNLKRQLGIQGDFCIYMVDQYGNIVTVDSSSGNYTSFGSANGNYTVNNQPCGKPLP